MSGMFGKNKRPLSDLLNPARRKGGTKRPPARRTKSFIHSLRICPCLSRAAFLVGWWGGESAGVVFSSFSVRTGPGLVPSRRLRQGLRFTAALGRAGQPRRAAVPRSRRSAARSPFRGAGAMERSHCAGSLRCEPGRRSAPAPPRPGVLRSVCCSFSDVLSQGAVGVFGVFRCLVSLLPV